MPTDKAAVQSIGEPFANSLALPILGWSGCELMSLTFLVVTFLLLVVLGLVLQSFFLWMGAKVVKIPGVSYRRALLTCVVISVVLLPIQGGIALCGWWRRLRN